MTISMLTKGDSTLVIQGDEQLFEKLPEGFDVSQVDISDEKIDAHNLGILANYAQYRGVEAVKRYFAVKAAFERQRALIAEQTKQPKVSYAPAITSRTIKQVDA